jgi:integrase
MSIHKINGKTGIRYQVKYLQSDGRQSAKNFRNKKEAQDFEASIRSAKSKGSWVDTKAATIKFSDYVEVWKTTKTNQRPRTAYRRDNILNKHLLPALGNMTLRSIHRSDIQKLVTKWTNDGLAPRTIKHHVRILHPIFQMAVLDDVIIKNPTIGVNTPRPGKVERHALSPSECVALITATPPEYQALMRIALATGMRYQEIQDLKIKDLDLLRKTLTIRQSKTDAGLRTIKLSDYEVGVIAEHLSSNGRTGANESEPLFTSPEGHEIHYRNFIQRVFKKAAINAGLPNITFHDLRRTHATILIASGASQKVVQERLGHRSISTTLALYAQGTEQGHIDASTATQKYIEHRSQNCDFSIPEKRQVQ